MPICCQEGGVVSGVRSRPKTQASSECDCHDPCCEHPQPHRGMVVADGSQCNVVGVQRMFSSGRLESSPQRTSGDECAL